MDIEQQDLAEAQFGYDKLKREKRDQVRKECVQKGLHWARSCVGTRTDGEVAQYMAEWIDEVEDRESKEQLNRSHGLAERGTNAAEASAESAKKSVDHSRSSARAAWASAFFALLAFIVALCAYFK